MYGQGATISIIVPWDRKRLALHKFQKQSFNRHHEVLHVTLTIIMHCRHLLNDGLAYADTPSFSCHNALHRNDNHRVKI